MDYPLRLTGQLREHLRALRKRSGLTQAQLGQRLGLGQVRIAEIEADPGLVSVEQLVRILSALGTTMVLRDQAAGAQEAAMPASGGPKRASSKPSSKASNLQRRGPAHAPPPRGKPARAEPTPEPTRDVATTARTVKHGKGSW